MQQCCYLDHGFRINLGCIALLRRYVSLAQNEFRVYFIVERKAIMLRVLGAAGFETWTGQAILTLSMIRLINTISCFNN
jgi:hypothetical protein